MSLVRKISAFARSPQGRRAMHQAQTYAGSPEGRRKIAGLRAKLGGKKPR